MYLEFYKLREEPFALSSDGRFFYASDKHNEALASMTYTIQQRKGLVMVSGEIGSGKTFLARMLCQQLGTGCVTIRISNPPSSGRQLLDLVARKVGLHHVSTDKLVLVEELENELIHLLHRGRLVAMVIDEAQDLSEDSMEELRLLWNWEDDGQRLIQIVLIGQPELKAKLAQPRWEALRQRVALSYHLGALTREDTARYVLHRVRVAAAEGCSLRFTRHALELVHDATMGIPRMINVLCDNALLAGYASGATTISHDLVSKAMREMTCWDLPSPPPLPTLNVTARITDFLAEEPTQPTAPRPTAHPRPAAPTAAPPPSPDAPVGPATVTAHPQAAPADPATLSGPAAAMDEPAAQPPVPGAAAKPAAPATEPPPQTAPAKPASEISPEDAAAELPQPSAPAEPTPMPQRQHLAPGPALPQSPAMPSERVIQDRVKQWLTAERRV